MTCVTCGAALGSDCYGYRNRDSSGRSGSASKDPAPPGGESCPPLIFQRRGVPFREGEPLTPELAFGRVFPAPELPVVRCFCFGPTQSGAVTQSSTRPDLAGGVPTISPHRRPVRRRQLTQPLPSRSLQSVEASSPPQTGVGVLQSGCGGQ